MAAVLSAGPGAALSHRSAAALWQIRPTARSRIEVTTPRKLRTLPILLRHCAILPADETTIVSGIRVTTLSRTLLDLAGVVDRPALERAANEAEVQRLGSILSVGEVLDRYPGRPGSPALRCLLDHVEPTITRSELEDRFIAFLYEADLPQPNVNTIIEGTEVDFAWREARLIVELDGFATHATRRAFERDRARDRMLQAAGWRVVRITWRQLHQDQRTLEQQLRKLLTPPNPPQPLTSPSMRG
jgi:REase_MTES_1575